MTVERQCHWDSNDSGTAMPLEQQWQWNTMTVEQQWQWY